MIDLENELLRLLNETRGSLLEDAELFNTLQTSKATSIAVQKSLETAETTEVQIDTAREVVLFFLMPVSIGLYILGIQTLCGTCFNFILRPQRHGKN